MTRQEAIEIEIKSARSWEPFSKIPDIDIREAAAGTIDCYVALGMLKLDEPKSAREMAHETISKYLSLAAADSVLGLLDQNGLKIVEK